MSQTGLSRVFVKMLQLNDRLRALRKSRHLKQEKAAELCGIGFTTYRRYETGEREPTASTLWRMADLFEVSVDYLIGRTDEP